MKKKVLIVALLILLVLPLCAANANISNLAAGQLLNRPPIVNSTLGADDFIAFKDTISKSLDLLQAYDPDAYIRVCLDIKQIGYQETTEIPNSLAISGQDGVFLTRLFVGQPDKFNPVFVAGVLSHESVHAAMMNRYFRYIDSLPLFLRNLASPAYISKEEEILAYQCQINTLTKIKAPYSYIQSCQELQQWYINQNN